MADFDTLKKIIPPDQAIANKALVRSLQQVKQIFNTTSSEFAPAVATLETNDGLDIIQNLDTPVPDFVKDYYEQNLAIGTGPRGRVTVGDLIGSAAGVVMNDQLPIAQQTLTNMASLGLLDSLTLNTGAVSGTRNGIYTTMQYVINGNYTQEIDFGGDPPDILYRIVIPAPQYGQGAYPFQSSSAAAIRAAWPTLYNLAVQLINLIAVDNPTEVALANDAYEAMGTQLSNENQNRQKAGINFAELQANVQGPMMSIMSSLHDIALDTTPGSPARFFEATANLQNIGGQSVVSSMREGRNIQRLNGIGVLLDTQIPGTDT